MISFFKKWFSSKTREPVDWEHMRSQFLASSEVKVGRTGHHLKLSKEASMLMSFIVFGIYTDQLKVHINDEDARIVAYCLIGLELMDSPSLEKLPELLFRRLENVKILSGHTLLQIPLNIFAQEVARRHKDGRSLDRWLSFGCKVDKRNLSYHFHHLRSKER